MRLGMRQTSYGENDTRNGAPPPSNVTSQENEIEDRKAKLQHAAQLIVQGKLDPKEIEMSYERGEITKEDAEYVFSLVEQMIAEKQAEQAPAPAAQAVSSDQRKAHLKALAHGYMEGRITEEDLLIMNQKGELSAEEIQCVMSMAKKEEAEQKVVEDVLIEDAIIQNEAPKVAAPPDKRMELANLVAQLVKKQVSPQYVKELAMKNVISRRDAKSVISKASDIIRKKEREKSKIDKARKNLKRRAAPRRGSRRGSKRPADIRVLTPQQVQIRKKEMDINRLDILAHDVVAGKLTKEKLSAMYQRGEISKDQKKYICKKSQRIKAEIKKQVEMESAPMQPMPQESVAKKVLPPIPNLPPPPPASSAPPSAPVPVAPPVKKMTAKDEKEIMAKNLEQLALINSEDQRIVDSLPDLLGFKFCPKLFVDSGILPPLQGNGVSTEYELAYLENIKILLNQLLKAVNGDEDLAMLVVITQNPNLSEAQKQEYVEASFRGGMNIWPLFYASLHGGQSLVSPTDFNPVFPRNFWLNVLGLRLEEMIEQPELLDKIFKKNSPIICSRLTTVCNGIASIKATLADISAKQVEEAVVDLQQESADPMVSPEELAVSQEVVQETVQEAQQAQQEAVVAQQEANQAALQEQVAIIQDNQQPQSDVQPSGIMNENGDVITTDIAATDTGEYDKKQAMQPHAQDILLASKPLPQPIKSDVPPPEEKPFYKKGGNQAIMVAVLVAAGLYMTSKKKAPKKASAPSLNPFRL